MARKSKKPQPRPGAEAPYCFVICPFGGWHDRYYEEIYRKAAEEAGLECRRVDDLYRPGAIVQEIWELIQNARIMIAELTGKNANVFYELGLAHASGKTVILTAQSLEDVPYDLRQLRVIPYSTLDPDWARDLRTKLKESLEQVLVDPESGVLAPFRSGRVRQPATRDQAHTSISELDQKLTALRAEIAPLVRVVERLEPYRSALSSPPTPSNVQGDPPSQ